MKGSGGQHSLAQIVDAVRSYPRLGFWEEFNGGVIDTDIWTETLDGAGTLQRMFIADVGTIWNLATGNVIDNDAGIVADAVYSKAFTPFEDGKTTVTLEAKIAFVSVADISALLGLFQTPPTDYAEPATDCAQFLMDPAITNTFRARSYDAAVEEETDTLIALDNALHKLGIIVTRTGVTFYIDDVLVATHVTRVPDVPMQIALLIRTEAAGAKSMRMDYVHVGVS